MARQVLCPPCLQSRKAASIKEAPGSVWTYITGTIKIQSPGEIVISDLDGVGGSRTRVPQCVCDSCNEPLPPGSIATCATFWSRGDRAPDYDPGWAEDYLRDITARERILY